MLVLWSLSQCLPEPSKGLPEPSLGFSRSLPQGLQEPSPESSGAIYRLQIDQDHKPSRSLKARPISLLVPSMPVLWSLLQGLPEPYYG